MTYDKAMTDPVSLPADAVEALRDGNKIEAIKRVRVATGLGLAEAKGLVEAYERGTPPPASTASPASMSRPAPPARAASTGLSPGQMPAANPWKWLSIVLAAAVAVLLGFMLLR